MLSPDGDRANDGRSTAASGKGTGLRKPNIVTPATPLRSNHFLVLLATAGLCLTVAGLLMPIPYKGRAADAIGDLVHAPLFGGFTLGLLGLLESIRPLRRRCSPLIRVGMVVAAMLAFGIGTELLQARFGRTASMHDFVADALGTFAATLVYLAWRLRQRRSKWRLAWRASLLAAGFLLAIAWWRPFTVLRDTAAMYRNFPLLASFESPIEIGRFGFFASEARLTREDATDGMYAMEVTFQATAPATASAWATMFEMKRDWSEMKTLEFAITLDESHPRPEAGIKLKIVDTSRHEDDEDAFRGTWTLKPGQTQAHPHHARGIGGRRGRALS